MVLDLKRFDKDVDKSDDKPLFKSYLSIFDV